MPHWWNIRPDIFQRDAFRIHGVTMTAIIFDFTLKSSVMLRKPDVALFVSAEKHMQET
jgi:hypothetical protein